jgi:hypothetical protein
VFKKPDLKAGVAPALERFRAAVAEGGYAVASRFIESSTYGGGSWFAHGTLATGVRVSDGLEYAVLLHADPPPKTMASVFKQAGYHTVLVQPGTTRPFPEGVIQGFETKYYSWLLGYQGPEYAWATMPDQYVLDFVHRRELEPARRAPAFIQYALVSSHAPWSVVPRVVEDWSRLEHGRIFHEYQTTFPIGWSNLKEGGAAYCHSLRYDFEVLQRYILERLQRNTLVIVMGDHQPTGAITLDDPSWAVPVHLVTKDRALLARFTAAGYVPGVFPPLTGPIPGMELFLPDLVERLSGD